MAISASTKRLLLWLPVLLIAVAAVVWLMRPQPVPVDLATVVAGPIRVTVDEEGQTRVRNVYAVASPIYGRLRRIDADVGDAVAAGSTILARIEPAQPTFLDIRAQAEMQAAVRTATAGLALVEAEIARVEAELNLARSELSRARALLRSDAVSEAVVDRRESEALALEAARAEAEARRAMREAELETARARLIQPGDERRLTVAEDGCCVPVTAPVTGVVLAVLEESETVVDAGRALIEVGDPSDLEVVVDVLSRDAVQIAEGARATIEGWGGPPLEATVRRVEPAGFTKISALGVEEQRVNIILDPTPVGDGGLQPGWQRLGHGYRVDVRITTFAADDVLKVPLAALFREGGSWAVFVDEDGRAALRLITVGTRDRTDAMVTAGLAAGERVVLYPSERIADGTRLVGRR